MNILTAVYGFIHLPANWSSFEKHESMSAVGTKNYVPLFAIISLSFASSLGVFCLPWMLFSEVFPFRYVDLCSNYLQHKPEINKSKLNSFSGHVDLLRVSQLEPITFLDFSAQKPITIRSPFCLCQAPLCFMASSELSGMLISFGQTKPTS